MSPRTFTASLTLLTTVLLAGCSDEPTARQPDARQTAEQSNPPSPSESQPGRPVLDGDDWLLYETSDATVGFTRLDGSTSAFPVIDTASVPSPQDNPDWSPDGARIAFVSSDGLWVMNADGSNASVLVPATAPSYLDDPSWSPDGRTIAFSRTLVRDDRSTSTLETVAIADGTFEVVAGPWRDAFSAGATWSPDGTQLAYEWVHFPGPSLDVEPTGVDLAVLTLRTGKVSTLLDPTRFPETADWSPDGRWIVAGYRPTPGADAPDLYLVRPDGSDLRRVTTLTDRGGYATHPSFALDGASLAFSGARNDSDSNQLLRVSTAGGQSQPLGRDPVLGSHPKFRPAD